MTARARILLALVFALTGCSKSDQIEFQEVSSPGDTAFAADVWADNWFALYVGETLILEDSVPITTERSFNAESFGFNADYPLQLNFVVKDFRENDTGLEYIGKRNQQIGDGGFIAQFRERDSGAIVATTDAGWKCLVTHRAPTDTACEREDEPSAGQDPCGYVLTPPPEGWLTQGFDDAHWADAIEYSERDVDPKQGYDAIEWHSSARLVWSEDLERDNTLLCRLTVSAPGA